MNKVELLQQIVYSANRYTMRSSRARKALAHRLAGELGLWEPPVQGFVEDMIGLSFYNTEDRQTFIQFFCFAYRFDM